MLFRSAKLAGHAPRSYWPRWRRGFVSHRWGRTWRAFGKGHARDVTIVRRRSQPSHRPTKKKRRSSPRDGGGATTSTPYGLSPHSASGGSPPLPLPLAYVWVGQGRRRLLTCACLHTKYNYATRRAKCLVIQNKEIHVFFAHIAHLSQRLAVFLPFLVAFA